MKEWLRLQIRARVERALQWAQDHPRPVFFLLRNLRPILVIKGFAVVTRFEDVREVLETDDVFHVPYEERMEDLTGGGNFFLGMNDSPEYDRDVSSMRLAMRREDLGRLAGRIDAAAAASVEEASGEMDVVRDLARVVATRTIVGYFGIDGAPERELFDWSSHMFEFLFIDPQDDADIRNRALESAARMRGLLDGCIADRKGSGEERDDVLGRCLTMQAAGMPGMDDTRIRDNLFGLIVGALPTTSKAATFALDVLLDRPAELAAAGDAARAGDVDGLTAIVLEAMRFNPINPGLLRVVARDHRLAAGHLRSKTLKAGTTVLAASQSAMFDSRVLSSPREFRTDRPSAHALHFGAGMHTCFGRHLNLVQIPRILKPLLQRPGLRRAEGEAGRVKMEGPFPVRLRVCFDAPA